MHLIDAIQAPLSFSNLWEILPDSLPRVLAMGQSLERNAWHEGDAAISELRELVEALQDELDATEAVLSRGIPVAKIPEETEDLPEPGEGRPKMLQPVSGDVAVIPLQGILHPKASMFAEFFGMATNTNRFAKKMEMAVNDPDIGAIVIDADTPGGVSFGNQEISEKLFNLRGQKPIYAIARPLMASAGYHLGSAADQVFAEPSAMLGSIGVLAVHYDVSGLNEKMGVRPTLVYAGRKKVQGNPDAPLDDEALSDMQDIVNDYYDGFVGSVARNRGVREKEVREGYGEGAALTARRAVAAGLADEVKSFDQLIRELTRGRRGGSARTSEQDMSQQAKEALEKTRTRLKLKQARAKIGVSD